MNGFWRPGQPLGADTLAWLSQNPGNIGVVWCLKSGEVRKVLGHYGALCLSAWLVACNGSARQRTLLLESAGKPREALALEGVSRLRDAFNLGACQSIFDEADLTFRLLQSQQAWLSDCERLHNELGSWRRFQTHLRHGPGIPLSVVVYGEAEFAGRRLRERTHVETVWHFDRGRAELFSLYLNGEAIPRLLQPRERYLDPPPKRESEPG